MRFLQGTTILFAAAWLSAGYAQNSASDEAPPRTQQAGASAAPDKLTVTVGKSMIIDSPVNIQRISVANGDLVEAVAVNPKEVLINGKQAGDTSLIIWQQGGNRLLYDLTVRMSTSKLDAIRQQLARDFPNDEINVTYENDTPFVRGTVKDTTAADRVMSIVGTLGKPVNLLRVNVPPPETQILLKVRFADVDRAATQDLGVNIVSGAFNQSTAITTGQYTPPTIGAGLPITISDALNVLLFRKDINLGVTIKALESKRVLQTLAEPNVLTTDGKPASFISGGEFPFPMVQGGASVGTVTISFREYGIKINFLPRITPRGTVQLQVTPEVSALDFANAVTFQGFTIPALSTRRINTEVELESGQSFMIAGLLDNTMTETLNKIPGLANIPLFGNLFKSRSRAKNNTELLVLVTPEVVRPIPAGQPAPMLHFPDSFLPPNSDFPMHQPGMDKTGPVPVKPPSETMPLEELIQRRREGQAAPQPTMQPMMLVPVPANPPASGQTTSTPASAPGGSGK
ncbi:MAG TPA: pilus assembly protein N-terminal domain-containing protein [Bryobacteraceae bacterium]|nr:pilus assembly protein N-terminal domain-containing protein [Bryobacteraceae bacterium]